MILLFILMFFGSKSIPGIARSLGKGLREIQHASNEIRNEIKNSADQIKKDTLIGNDLQETIQALENKQHEMIAKVDREVKETLLSAEQKFEKTRSETTDPADSIPEIPNQEADENEKTAVQE